MADSNLHRNLRPALLGLVAFYLYLAGEGLLVWSSASRIPPVLSALGAALLLLGMARSLGTPLGRRLGSHRTAFLAGVVVMAHTLLWMLRDPLASPGPRLSVVLLGGSMVLLSARWLAALSGLVVGGLVGGALLIPGVGLEDNAMLSLLAATVTAFIVQRFHVRSVRRLTDLRRAAEEERQAREESDERYRLAAEGSSDGLYDWNLRTQSVFFSNRWQSLLGEGQPLDSDPAEWLGRIHPDDASRVRESLERHWSGATAQFEEEHRLRQADGEYRWVLARGVSQRAPDGTAIRMAGSLTDLSTRGLFDPLTGLPNRRLLIERLERALAARGRDDSDFSVLFVDLDRFKLVNDSLGHSAGDALLIEAAARIQSCVRATDTVARLGGDEFVIVLERVDVPEGVLVTIERIQSKLSVPMKVDARELHLGASIGAVMDTRGYDDALDVLRDADTAMYEAKQRGQPWAVFDVAMRERLSERLSLEGELHLALRCEQFVVHYQPIVDVDSEVITGYEALVRWDHPERGLVGPNHFIEVMEETGLIVELGEWVLRSACVEIMTAFPAGGSDPAPSVSVNVSRIQLRPTFAEEVAAILQEVGFDPRRLKLEITETAILQQPELAADTLRSLRTLGVQIMMDDFGTGHSSLGVLQVLPIDQLKIDRSFVQRISEDPQAAELVRAIIAMGRGLGLQVVAEGVETQAQLESLRSFECDLGQGFLFARPAGLRDVGRALAS